MLILLSKDQYYFQLEQEDAIFDSRFLNIWEGLMTFPKTRKWDMTLSSSPPEVWLSRIKEHTPKPFRSILASLQAPTIARLESLEWSDTRAAGVYGLVWKPKRKSVYLCFLVCGCLTLNALRRKAPALNVPVVPARSLNSSPVFHHVLSGGFVSPSAFIIS